MLYSYKKNQLPA